MRYRNIIRFTICSMILIIVIGCGEDFGLFTETLEIQRIESGQSSVGVGQTTTLEAFVSYSGDETVLMYEWSADAGTIGGSGNTATYIAPNSPGTYSITLRISDGAISDERSIQIGVGQEAVESIIMDFDTHWPAIAHKDKLSYRVNIKSIPSGKVSIYYDVTQDRDEFDAFFSIDINGITVMPEMAIGATQPSTARRTDGQIDVSGVINSTGWYTIDFFIRPGDQVASGWLMNEAKIIGAQGTADPQQ